MKLENIKVFSAMTAEEQERWVCEFTEWMDKGRRLAKLSSGWSRNDITDMEQGLRLLASWPFCEDFCEKTAHFADYDRRAYRLPLYIDKVVEELASGLTIQTIDGRKVVQVSPSVPLRRRGRPTKEEIAARLRGEALVVQGDDAEARRRRAIAKLLGMEVIVSGEAPREKNNAELKAEREARKAQEEKMNPSLFGNNAAAEPQPTGQGAHQPSSISHQTSGVSPCAQIMSDSYEARMAQDKLHLDQLAWMCSKPLQERIKLVQSQRTAAESASERAKTMADLGQPADAIAEYTQQAKVATEAYLQTYADIDTELAILHKRLYLDLPFVEQFKQRFKGVDIEKIQYITRPYYEKVKSPELDLRIKTIIEQENPEYAAKMKAEEEKKQEVSELLRYLKRKDKPNVKQRIETMEKRYQRLIELLGEDEAKIYRPIVDAAIEDYEKNHKKPEPAPVVSDSVADKKKAAKKTTKKTAGKTAATAATAATTTTTKKSKK
jgi:hypothetical protein